MARRSAGSESEVDHGVEVRVDAGDPREKSPAETPPRSYRRDNLILTNDSYIYLRDTTLRTPQIRRNADDSLDYYPERQVIAQFIGEDRLYK